MIFQRVDDPDFDGRPEGGGRPEHRRHVQQIPDVLDVIAVISNPVRYRSRYDLFRAFETQVHEAGARLTVVEMAFGQRPFEITQADNPRHLQVRSAHEMWHKENLINLGVARLPRDSRYVAWVDADLTFVRHDWVQETLQQLQHYPIVQMFAEAHDLDPEGMLLTSFRSFCWSHIHGIPRKRRGLKNPGEIASSSLIHSQKSSLGRKSTASRIQLAGPRGDLATATTTLSFGDYYGPGMDGIGSNSRIGYWHHPGFAWAARREVLDSLGGLFDVAIVGEADYMMAKSIVGEVSDMLYPGVSAGYRKAALDWQDRARSLRLNLGYVPGTILHHWHGKKANRKYWDRCKILTDSQFDPTIDLRRDWQGLYQLADHGEPRSILLRDAIRSYFRSRNEDGTEL